MLTLMAILGVVALALAGLYYLFIYGLIRRIH